MLSIHIALSIQITFGGFYFIFIFGGLSQRISQSNYESILVFL